MVRAIVLGTLRTKSGEDRGAWQVVREGQPGTNSSPKGNISSPETCGSSSMESSTGYNRTISFRTIVNHRAAVGSVNHHTLEDRQHPIHIPASATHYPSWQQYMNIQPTIPTHLPMDNPSFLTQIEFAYSFFNRFSTFKRRYRRGIFMNYSEFTDRMYFSETTRNRQKNRLVRSADGNRWNSEVIHSSMPEG